METPMNRILSCRVCNRSTKARNGFIYGVTLRKDPFNQNEYLCEKDSNQNEIPWRIKKPNEFRALLSQLGNPSRGKKKTMSKMRKARV
jgi:hypothetical protein